MSWCRLVSRPHPHTPVGTCNILSLAHTRGFQGERRKCLRRVRGLPSSSRFKRERNRAMKASTALASLTIAALAACPRRALADASTWTSVISEQSALALPRYGETVKGLQVQQGEETCLYQFGGVPYQDSLQRLCPSTASVKGWQTVAAKTSSAAPAARALHAAASDPGRPSLMWIHGGQDSTGDKLSDLWRFDASTRSWQLVSNATATGPPALVDHTMDYGSGELVVFGGEAANGVVSSVVWILVRRRCRPRPSPLALAPRPRPRPRPRLDHGQDDSPFLPLSDL